MAWLNARPKPPAGSKRAKAADARPVLTRLEQLKKSGVAPEMPPNPMPHIITRLVEIGLSEPAGMGIAPISWPTIIAWRGSTGVALDPWEARLLRQLSIAYVAEGQRAESETAPPPWRREVTKREIETDETRLRMLLG